MAWKVERWLADVFPGEENLYAAYKDLPPRELAIVAAAVLDSALAEILALRLKSVDKEVESFLGLNGDGRAHVASFGARIQLALGLFSVARLTRLVRSELLDVMSREYITTARSKGLSERAVTMRHGIRNIVVPIVTLVALDFSVLIGGAVIVETIFAWPGLGRLMFQEIGQRDFPIIQSGVFVIALMVVAINLAADLIYAWFDPRIRYS